MTVVSTADLLATLPELLVMTGGCLVLVLDPLTPQHRKEWLTYLSLATLGVAFVVGYWFMGSFRGAPRPAFSGLYILDAYGTFWKLLLIGLSALIILLAKAHLKLEEIDLPEFYALILLSLSGLMVVGFGFKVAAVPFHMWTPDVYEGSPTSVTAYMAVASKAASFAAFVRVFLVGLGGLKEDWQMLLVAVCAATLILGNVVAIVQSNIKRMLAYSSIAHAGYALIGLIVADSFGTASVMLYLAIYAFMTLGAFTVVTMLRRGGLEGDTIDDFTGLAKRNKWAALVMLLFMISLTGIPPTGGFIAKFYVFMAAVSAGMTGLAVLAVIFAAVSAYYYLRVVMVMYMRDPGEAAGTPGYNVQVVVSPATIAVLLVASVAVLILGVFPDQLVKAAQSAVLPLK